MLLHTPQLPYANWQVVHTQHVPVRIQPSCAVCTQHSFTDALPLFVARGQQQDFNAQ
jgi:hypothetical protein